MVHLDRKKIKSETNLPESLLYTLNILHQWCQLVTKSLKRWLLKCRSNCWMFIKWF